MASPRRLRSKLPPSRRYQCAPRSMWSQRILRVILITSTAWLHLNGHGHHDASSHCKKSTLKDGPMQFDQPEVQSPDVVTFTVQAERDAVVGLSPTSLGDREIYTIVIGGNLNTVSTIGRCEGDSCEWTVGPVSTPWILNASNPRGFWIETNGSYIAVGKLGRSEPFMYGVDPAPITVRFLGYASGSPCTWDFCGGY
ncbi:uncharacterized protein [Asterias amurensis]|uniref:uncharacterized protein n=1 Tax=Asterias amurensis TaxID=7602 RepID=UPI003AB58893